MSQPPQNGWGTGGDASGQQGGYDQGGYGQPSADGYGQPSADGYGQPSADGYGQSSPSAYGQPSPAGYGQASPSGYGEAAGGYGQSSAAPAYAPEFGTGPTAPVDPPKKGGGMKIALFACIGCVVLALIVGLIGGGIWFFTRDGGKGRDDDPSTSTSQPQTDGPTDGPTTEDPTDGPTDQPAGDGKGTRDQPFAPGEQFTLEDGNGGTYDVTIGDVNWDATSAVMGENQFNTEPADDQTYIMFPVTLTYHGSDSVLPLVALRIQYVSASGNAYSESGIAPDGAVHEGELFDGGKAEYNEALIIPKDAVKDGGQIQVDVAFNFSSEPVWVSTK